MEIRLLQQADYSAVREIYKAVRNEYLQYLVQASGEIYDPVGPDLDILQLDFYAATHSSLDRGISLLTLRRAEGNSQA